MERHVFKMCLDPGREAEYKRRHDALWPQLRALLQEAGISNYSIHLDPETHVLFAYLERPRDHGMDRLAAHPVMRLWWEHMRDVMRTNPDGSPVTAPLRELFHMA